MLFIRWNPSSRSPDVVSGPPAGTAGADDVVVATSRPRTGLLVARCFGELDLLTAGPVARTLTAGSAELRRERAATGGDAPVLVCELAGVPFCGAAGIRMLLDLDRSTTADGNAFVLAAPSRQVSRVLDLTGAAAALTVRADLGALLA